MNVQPITLAILILSANQSARSTVIVLTIRPACLKNAETLALDLADLELIVEWWAITQFAVVLLDTLGIHWSLVDWLPHLVSNYLDRKSKRHRSIPSLIFSTCHN